MKWTPWSVAEVLLRMWDESIGPSPPALPLTVRADPGDEQLAPGMGRRFLALGLALALRAVKAFTIDRHPTSAAPVAGDTALQQAPGHPTGSAPQCAGSRVVSGALGPLLHADHCPLLATLLCAFRTPGPSSPSHLSPPLRPLPTTSPSR